MSVHPAQFANTLAAVHIPTHSSGVARQDRAGINSPTFGTSGRLCLFLEARGRERWVHGHCGILRRIGAHAMLRLSWQASPSHLVSHVDPSVPLTYGTDSIRLVRWGTGWPAGR
jgi:hypothetical protein